MDSIRISIIQTDIVWENKQENLRLLHEKPAKPPWNNGDCCFTGDVFYRVQHAKPTTGRTKFR